jgi:hypothetical protein
LADRELFDFANLGEGSAAAPDWLEPASDRPDRLHIV